MIETIIKIMAWPAIVLVCFIFACIYFRKHISGLLDRTTSVGKDGLKTASPMEQKTQEIDKLKQSQDLGEVLTSPVLLERESLIRADLKKRGLDGTGDAVAVLIRYLAVTQLIVVFEEAYRIIFGSQIFLLKSANENRVAGISDDFVNQHFDEMRKIFTPFFDTWTKDQYMNFLLTSNFLLKDKNIFRITNIGVEFLGWMTKIGVPEKKMF